jgi:FkbM family methyltransferase
MRDAAGLIDTGGFNRCRRCRHGNMLYNVNDVHVGRSLDLYGEWAEAELELTGLFLAAGDVVIDVGANLGTHAIFFARKVGPGGHVFALEPQRVVFQALCANVALNSLTNVHTLHAAAGRQTGTIRVPQIAYEVARNFGGVALGGDGPGEVVAVTTLDLLPIARGRTKLLKIDVEGMELDVLQGARALIDECRPILYLENNDRARSPALIQHLQDLGYHLFWHFSPFYNPKNHFGNADNVFGALGDINMIGVGPTLAPAFQRFPRVAGPDDDWESSRLRLAPR